MVHYRGQRKAAYPGPILIYIGLGLAAGSLLTIVYLSFDFGWVRTQTRV